MLFYDDTFSSCSERKKGSVLNYWRKYSVFPPVKTIGSLILQWCYKCWEGSVEEMSITMFVFEKLPFFFFLSQWLLSGLSHVK